MSTYTSPDQERCEPITPTKLPASPQPGRHESLTPVRAGTRSNLLPLQNCHGTHNHVLHESLHSSRLGLPQTLLPLQNSQGTHNAAAHKSLHNIEQEYHHLLLPLQTSHRTRNSYEALLFRPSTFTNSKMHLVKFYAFLRLPWIRGWVGRAAAQRDEPPHDQGSIPALGRAQGGHFLGRLLPTINVWALRYRRSEIPLAWRSLHVQRRTVASKSGKDRGTRFDKRGRRITSCWPSII